jgi:hypothetical protein
MGRARLEKASANQHIPFKQALAQFPPKTLGFRCSLQRVEFCLTPRLTRSTSFLWKYFMYVSLFTSLFKVITIAFQILPERMKDWCHCHIPHVHLLHLFTFS